VKLGIVKRSMPTIGLKSPIESTLPAGTAPAGDSWEEALPHLAHGGDSIPKIRLRNLFYFGAMGGLVCRATRWESEGATLPAALNMHRCHSHIFVPLLSALGVPVHHGLISAHLCRLCRSRCEGCDGAEIFAVCSHHQVGTSWLSPRHHREIKDFHLRARHGGGRSENGLACHLRRRLWRRLTHKRYPND